jgi:PST family polysaccharide transporter
VRSGIRGRVVRATFWSAINAVLTRLVTIVITAVVVRMMTPREFGVYAVALTVFTVVSAFSEFGLAACLVRHDVDVDAVGPTVAMLSLVVGGVLAALMAITAGPLAGLLGVPAAAAPLRVLSLCVLLIGLFTVPCGLMMREFRQDALLVASIVSFVPSNIALVLLASDGDGAMAFAWSRVIGQVVMGAVLAWYAGRWFRPRIDPAQLRAVLSFGVPLAGSKLVKFILLNADYLFIGRLLGATPLGVYTLAFNVGSWSNSVLDSVMGTVAMPAFSHERDDPARLRSLLRHAVSLLALVALPISLVSLALAGPIVETLYGERYSDAAPILVVLSMYGAFFVLVQLLGNVLVGLGRSSAGFWLQLLWLATLVPAMTIGVLVGGTKGAAWAHVIVIVGIVLPAFLIALRPQIPDVARVVATSSVAPLTISGIAAGAAWLVAYPVHRPVVELMLGGGASVVVYLLLAVPLLRVHLPGRVWERFEGPLRRYDGAVNLLATRFSPWSSKG